MFYNLAILRGSKTLRRDEFIYIFKLCSLWGLDSVHLLFSGLKPSGGMKPRIGIVLYRIAVKCWFAPSPSPPLVPIIRPYLFSLITVAILIIQTLWIEGTQCLICLFVLNFLRTSPSLTHHMVPMKTTMIFYVQVRWPPWAQLISPELVLTKSGPIRVLFLEFFKL